MTSSKRPEDMVKELCVIQKGLVTKLLNDMHVVDLEYFKDLQDGAIEYGGKTWSYRRHGAGVAFQTAGGTIVDAHVAMAKWPAAIDAWRLYLYLESVGVQEFWYDDHLFAVDGETSMQQLLDLMAVLGVVRAVKDERRPQQKLYILVVS